MDRIALYRVFTRVIETRSFTRAADTLHLPRSSVSTAIADLEARLGARLLNRTTRSVTPTEEGERFHERCLVFLAEAEEMEQMFRGPTHQVTGRVRVDMPSRIGRLILAPALPDFLSRWPGIKIELGVTDRAVDLFSEGVDCALRVGSLPDSRLRARRIGEISQINVASPRYLAEHGVPLSPSDLDLHWQVTFASPSTGRATDWEWLEDKKVHSRPVPWRVAANSAEGYIACALSGLGLIQIPTFDVADHLAAGDLVEVMPDARPSPMPMHLLFTAKPGGVRRLSVFSDWLEALLRDRIAG